MRSRPPGNGLRGPFEVQIVHVQVPCFHRRPSASDWFSFLDREEVGSSSLLEPTMVFKHIQPVGLATAGVQMESKRHTGPQFSGPVLNRFLKSKSRMQNMQKSIRVLETLAPKTDTDPNTLMENFGGVDFPVVLTKPKISGDAPGTRGVRVMGGLYPTNLFVSPLPTWDIMAIQQRKTRRKIPHKARSPPSRAFPSTIK